MENFTLYIACGVGSAFLASPSSLQHEREKEKKIDA